MDLADLCGELAEEVKGLAERKGVELAVEVKPEVGIVTGDRRRLSQALGNVVKNAISYTKKGGRVLLRAEGGRDAARIIVSDNGRGIAPADQARVFDRFQRTAEGAAARQAAIGLGLPLARQFVEAHGGTIAAPIEAGRGDDGHHPAAAHRRAARRLHRGARRRMIRLADAEATEAIGAALAASLRPGDVIALFGALGAGKTTLARGLLRGLGHDGDVASPTFPIVQAYAPPDTRIPLWHVDLYRIEDASELDEIGLGEARGEAAMVIEWPERLPALWPDALRLTLGRRAGAARALTALVPPAWGERWPPR